MDAAALPRTSSSTSGFFFCGITLDGDANWSASSTNPNSVLDHITKSSASLLAPAIITAAAEANSAAKSRELVASTEFSISPSNPSSPAVVSLSMGQARAADGPRAERADVGPVEHAGKALMISHEGVGVGPAGSARTCQPAPAAGGCTAALQFWCALTRASTRAPAASTTRSIMSMASSRTFILMSAATWSLRERAVCMRPPASLPASAAYKGLDQLVNVPRRRLRPPDPRRRPPAPSRQQCPRRRLRPPHPRRRPPAPSRQQWPPAPPPPPASPAPPPCPKAASNAPGAASAPRIPRRRPPAPSRQQCPRRRLRPPHPRRRPPAPSRQQCPRPPRRPILSSASSIFAACSLETRPHSHNMTTWAWLPSMSYATISSSPPADETNPAAAPASSPPSLDRYTPHKTPNRYI